MKRARGLDDLDLVIGGVSCFGALMVAILLLTIAPKEHALCSPANTVAPQDCFGAADRAP